MPAQRGGTRIVRDRACGLDLITKTGQLLKARCGLVCDGCDRKGEPLGLLEFFEGVSGQDIERRE